MRSLGQYYCPGLGMGYGEGIPKTYLLSPAPITSILQILDLWNLRSEIPKF